MRRRGDTLMNMSQDELVNAIEDEKITAISIDTNVFDKAHYGFESGVLSRVRQFAESSTDFVMSDIIVGEVLAHLKVSAADSRRVYEKAAKDLSKGWALPPKRREELSTAAFGDKTAEQVANERLTKYLQDTSALIVKPKFPRLKRAFSAKHE
jgi:predicted nucleic acid-binding protein